MKYFHYKYLLGVAIILFMGSCSKNFLDAKPNKAIVVPNKLDDFEAMLDDVSTFNTAALSIQEIAVDDLFATDAIYTGRTPIEQGIYIWEDDPEFAKGDWARGYQKVFKANAVLDLLRGFESKTPLEITRKNTIYSTAMFFRGLAFWEMLQVFSPVYDNRTATGEMGIVLMLTSDVQNRSPRADLETSYRQVIADLTQAILYLPEQTAYKTRPNKASAYGIMARVMLSMNDYEGAYKYADSALNLYSTLIDYNSLRKASANANPFIRFNAEVIFHSVIPSITIYSTSSNGGFIDSVLYNSYAEHDLRKNLLFSLINRYQKHTGAYGGNARLLSGVATDELYLIRAESHARLGRVNEAMLDLNKLMITRWRTGFYTPFTASNEDQALTHILRERRKQLLQRGLRWTDLRRLNKDPRFAKTIERLISGRTYQLEPNDRRYTFLIPNDELLFNGLVKQNPR